MQLDHQMQSGLSLPGLDPALLQAALGPRLTLLWGANAPTRSLLAMLALLAVRGQAVRVYDGGNRFDGYFVSRLARRLSHQPHAALHRIRLSRAFTCFQLAELIQGAEAQPVPLFVLDLLSTFYDESVPLADAARLLGATIMHLKRLASVGPVIVGAREPQTLVKERWSLLDQLQGSADAIWFLRPPESIEAPQPRLF